MDRETRYYLMTLPPNPEADEQARKLISNELNKGSKAQVAFEVSCRDRLSRNRQVHREGFGKMGAPGPHKDMDHTGLGVKATGI